MITLKKSKKAIRNSEENLCPNCGKEIIQNASYCPYCQKNIKVKKDRGKSFLKGILIIFVVIIVLFVVLALISQFSFQVE